jgi:transposase-like protein
VDKGLWALKNMSMTMEKQRRRRYDEAFKREAVRLWRTSTRSAEDVAQELGMSAQTLYAWGREDCPRGDGPPGTGAKTLRELELEVGRLRAENEKLLRQQEILKKTLGIMTETPKSPMSGSKP